VKQPKYSLSSKSTTTITGEEVKLENLKKNGRISIEPRSSPSDLATVRRGGRRRRRGKRRNNSLLL
jgi:hypothetical protein